MTMSRSSSLRFTRLSLENWKNFTRADSHLGRRVFLIGPNAAGKSNLLDAFGFLGDVVAVGGGFQEAVRTRGGISALRCLAARRVSEVRIDEKDEEGDAPHGSPG